MPRPGRFTPGKIPGTHCIAGWVGSKGRSGRVRKISPPPGFDPRTLQLVARCYTDWAIPVPSYRHGVYLHNKPQQQRKLRTVLHLVCCTPQIILSYGHFHRLIKNINQWKLLSLNFCKVLILVFLLKLVKVKKVKSISVITQFTLAHVFH